jgi:hypothetical protein
MTVFAGTIPEYSYYGPKIGHGPIASEYLTSGTTRTEPKLMMRGPESSSEDESDSEPEVGRGYGLETASDWESEEESEEESEDYSEEDEELSEYSGYSPVVDDHTPASSDIGSEGTSASDSELDVGEIEKTSLTQIYPERESGTDSDKNSYQDVEGEIGTCTSYTSQHILPGCDNPHSRSHSFPPVITVRGGSRFKPNSLAITSSQTQNWPCPDDTIVVTTCVTTRTIYTDIQHPSVCATWVSTTTGKQENVVWRLSRSGAPAGKIYVSTFIGEEGKIETFRNRVVRIGKRVWYRWRNLVVGLALMCYAILLLVSMVLNIWRAVEEVLWLLGITSHRHFSEE